MVQEHDECGVMSTAPWHVSIYGLLMDIGARLSPTADCDYTVRMVRTAEIWNLPTVPDNLK